jgi:acyl-CoA thioester hydrolase
MTHERSVFEMAFEATEAEIDELGHVNNAAWVRWIQDVATAHWTSAATPEQIAAYVWVVTRHEIDYLRALGPGGKVTARTWVGDAPSGARFDRFIEFVGESGKPHVRSRTTWAMIDVASGRPARIPQAVTERFL